MAKFHPALFNYYLFLLFIYIFSLFTYLFIFEYRIHEILLVYQKKNENTLLSI